MKDKNSENLIRTFFGKHFSKQTRYIFANWLISPKDALDKENIVFKIWEENNSIETSSTKEEWNKLQNKCLYTNDFNPRILLIDYRWFKYAGIVILVLLASLSSYLISKEKNFSNIEMSELFVPYGEERHVQLPDSSEVYLKAGSLLCYPKDFGQESDRAIYLIGEAYFCITKNPHKPFVVKTANMNVKALGTTFSVQAYPYDHYTFATLEEGSIEIDLPATKDNKHRLKPGEQICYSNMNKCIQVHSVDISLHQMERNGYLILENVTFKQLMISIERKYNILATYETQEYANDLYNIKFAPKDSLEDALDILKELIGFNYKIKDNIVYIK